MKKVDRIIAQKTTNLEWLAEGWRRHIHSLLNAEEADEVAVHFESEGAAASSNRVVF